MALLVVTQAEIDEHPVLDSEWIGGMIVDIDRIIESAGCGWRDAATQVARSERLDFIEAVQLRLAYEQKHSSRH